MSNSLETKKKYDSWSGWYSYLYGSDQEGIEFFSNSVGKTLDKFVRGGHILDAGCGVGLSSGGLLKSGFSVTGVDLSPESIKKCRFLFSNYQDKAIFLVGDLLELPSNLQNFDGAVATTAVLHHFLSEEEQLQVLTQLSSILKPGGILLLSTSDYQRRLNEEPDDFFTMPVKIMDTQENKEFIYFKQRIWRGNPRERIYKSIYYRVNDSSIDRMELTLFAITKTEINSLLEQAGFESMQWYNTKETGFHKEICIAQKI